MFLDPKELSKVGYNKCREGNDIERYKQLITAPFWAYRFCKNINDDKDVRKFINNSIYAYLYCVNIKDRNEVAKFITEEKLKKKLRNLRRKRILSERK